MAKTKEKTKEKSKKDKTKKKIETIPEIQVIKPEIIKKETKEEEDIEEEFLEDDSDFSDSFPSSFSYPFLRRAAPTIRIQPITTNLEIDLEDIQIPTKKEEDNNDQYKPTPEKNYSLNQKYELPSGASYDSMTPKQVAAPQPPTLTPNFSDQMNAARGFGNQNTPTPGYPGQESSERKYDSGLEQQTQQDKRRRDM